MDAKQKSDLHNRLAGKIVRDIIVPMTEAGSSTEDMLVLTESVVVGVLLLLVKLGGDETVAERLFSAVKTRMAEARLRDIKAAGAA